jgi:gluconokinase
MGVSGSGKTTVGRLLAADLGWDFLDADDFHSPANRDKMSRGLPLSDADREPWLDALAEAVAERSRAGRRAVLACSALKQSYRDRLQVENGVRLVYLKGDPETIERRLESRKGHYFAAGLLASQFEALEEPTDALVVDLAEPPEAIVSRIESEWGLGV